MAGDFLSITLKWPTFSGRIWGTLLLSRMLWIVWVASVTALWRNGEIVSFSRTFPQKGSVVTVSVKDGEITTEERQVTAR
jgi:hypothetical protein